MCRDPDTRIGVRSLLALRPGERVVLVRHEAVQNTSALRGLFAAKAESSEFNGTATTKCPSTLAR
jgi:hypothetical protein